jgi:anaerobic selenocysteine-containing dehydrogenase
MTITTKKTYCRVCHAYCAMDADVDETGRLLAVRGDVNDPVYGGYTCIKGRQLPEMLNHPERLRSSLKRTASGDFEEISTQQALDEIAEKLRALIDTNSPRSVASYCGTHSFQNSAQLAVAKGWHAGMESPSFYTSVTIDQPAKFVAMARHGLWSAGGHDFETADVILVVGNNPLVSVFSPYGGIPAFSPSKSLRDAKKRGLKMIVIDPRRTEAARYADIHLAPKPGEDPTLLAGMARVILEEGLYDEAFCAEHVQGLDRLRETVELFTPEYVEARAGVPAEQMIAAARMYAGGTRGGVSCGTGPNMAPHSNVTEHFVLALASLCGRVHREGDKVPNPGILSSSNRKAQAIAPFKAWGIGADSRVRGLSELFIGGVGEMPTAALADEILTPGDGQVKALLCMGGNPVVAWPNQEKVLRAIDSLELMVCVDVRLSATAKLADYVIAPKITLEREDVNILTDSWHSKPYVHYTQAVADPGFDAIEEWEVYWELAHRLGSPIKLAGGEVPLDERPTKLSVMELVLPKPRIPLAEIRAAEGGQLYEQVDLVVQPADPGNESRLDVGPVAVCEELREIRAEEFSTTGAGYGEDADGFSHRLISRRLRQVYNSSGQYLKAVIKQGTTNPAFMHPDDLTSLGLADGDLIEIRSAHASIPAVAEASDEIRPGVISMAHAWGDTPSQDAKVRELGSSTNRLVDDETDYDPISGMARQSAIPVNVHPLTEAAPPA